MTETLKKQLQEKEQQIVEGKYKTQCCFLDLTLHVSRIYWASFLTYSMFHKPSPLKSNLYFTWASFNANL